LKQKKRLILGIAGFFSRMRTRVYDRYVASWPSHEYECFNSNVSTLYNNDVIYIYNKSWEYFFLWTSLRNFPITILVKHIGLSHRIVSTVSNSGW